MVCENSADAGSLKIVTNAVVWGCLSVVNPVAMRAHHAPPLEADVTWGTLPFMDRLPPPLAFLFLLFSGWINRQQQDVIEYLLEENRVLRAAHAPQHLRLTDDQRRRLAVKGKHSAGGVSPTLPVS